MALKALIDSLDGLPEAIAAHYTKTTDGKFVLSVEEAAGYALENVAGLKQALTAEREAHKTAAKALKNYEGIEDAAAARHALEQLKAGQLKGSAELDAYRKQLEEKVANDLKAATGRVSAYEKQLQELRFGTEARDAISKAKGKAPLLLPILERRMRWETGAEGQMSYHLVGDDGKPMTTKKPGSADPMTVAEYIETLKTQPDYAPAFEATAPAGSGSNHAAGGTARMGDNQPKLSPEARLAAIAQATTVVR